MRKKGWYHWPLRRGDAMAAGAVASVVGLIAASGAFGGVENATLDLRFRLRGKRDARAPVAIVAVDEASLAAIGQMPWDRRYFARLLGRLRESGVTVVAFDVAFSEPARNRTEDSALALAIGQFGPVILPVFRPLQSGTVPGPALVQPLPELRSVAAGFGLAHFGVRPDDAVRVVETQQSAGNVLVPTLGLATARALSAWGPDTEVVIGRARGAALRGRGLADGGERAPEDLALDYLGPPGTVQTVSALEVLRGTGPVAGLAGKAVLVGATAAGLPDTGFRGPFEGPYAGVEIHATVAENLLSGGGLRIPSWPLAAAGWVLLAMTAGWGLAATRLAPMSRLALLAGSLGAIAAGSWAAFMRGWWVPVVGPAILLAACALSGILRKERELLGERARLLGWYADELAREAKRQREIIDGELHDEAQQLLVVMEREVRRLGKVLGEGALGMLPDLVGRTKAEIIRVRKALVPHTLSRQGLRVAAEEMVREAGLRSGARTELDVDSWPDGLDPLLESEIYWLLKEALNNAVKHAGASQIRVTLSGNGGGIQVEIADDGRGFEVPPLDRPPQTHEHTGLHRMWVRARGLGGDMLALSAPGRGARIRFRLPVRQMTQGMGRG